VVPGGADATNGDQADVSITSHIDDVVTTTGLDYNPNPSGADLTEVVRLRLTDRDNNYGGTSGTSTDLDFAAPIDCVSTRWFRGRDVRRGDQRRRADRGRDRGGPRDGRTGLPGTGLRLRHEWRPRERRR
jgi:hypothetical protein